MTLFQDKGSQAVRIPVRRQNKIRTCFEPRRLCSVLMRLACLGLRWMAVSMWASMDAKARAARVRRLERVWQTRSMAGASGGAALVTMVQAADFRERDHVTVRDVLDAPWRRCVFGQR
jgi:hypothetical protein